MPCGARAPTVEAVHFDRKESLMQTYAILRRGCWRDFAEVDAAAERSRVEGERMPDDVAWIRSYVLEETDGRVGTVCIYQASGPEAIRRHANEAVLPVDEIVKVVDTVIVRPDPMSVPA
jgi:sporulation protein YlmC with PRC-barrel domain